MAVGTTVVTGLEPRAFWAHFETLTRIPRPSRQEEPAIDYVRDWASRHGSLGLALGIGAGYMIAMWTAVAGVLFFPANGTQIAAAEADETGSTTLGKRVVDHSFQLPLQIAWVVTALVGCLIVYLFFGDQTPAPPAPTTTAP